MSGAVSSLVQRDWVVKTPDPDDARSSVVSLSPAGRAELARVRSHNADAVAARFEALDDHDLADLATTVSVLRDLMSHPSKGTL